MRMRFEAGLTLIEVVLTTLIVAMLATVATFGVDLYLNEGKTRQAEADLATLRAAVRLLLLDHYANLPLPSTFNPATELVPEYLPELPRDPFALQAEGYLIELRVDPRDGMRKVYLRSRGQDGRVGTVDDLGYYVP